MPLTINSPLVIILIVGLMGSLWEEICQASADTCMARAQCFVQWADSCKRGRLYLFQYHVSVHNEPSYLRSIELGR